jgi:uracil phosphoribosyltransferase
MQPVPEHSPMAGRSQPTRSEVVGADRLRIVASGLPLTLLGRVRDRRTRSDDFARIVATIGQQLIAAASAEFALQTVQAPGFDGEPIEIQVLAERIAGVAVLRAGMAFAPSLRALLPDAPLYQIGAHRDEQTLAISLYADNLPKTDNWADRVLLLDPMLATGGSVLTALQPIRRYFSGPVTVIALVAAPLGVETVLAADPGCSIVTAALDESLDTNGYIRPGLGDAGDRTFGTVG